jgi:hypothetical protein
MLGLVKKPLRFNGANLKDNLGNNNYIFVGSGIDMWAKEVEYGWIIDTLEHCRRYSLNNYLFQTKNPERLYKFINMLPGNALVGVTVETNRDGTLLSDAPDISARYYWLKKIRQYNKIMISMEPIVDFDIDKMVAYITELEPEFVSIGADSKGHKLPEPPAEKIHLLIKQLKSEDIKVIEKNNLTRLL